MDGEWKVTNSFFWPGKDVEKLVVLPFHHYICLRTTHDNVLKVYKFKGMKFKSLNWTWWIFYTLTKWYLLPEQIKTCSVLSLHLPDYHHILQRIILKFTQMRVMECNYNILTLSDLLYNLLPPHAVPMLTKKSNL